MLYSSKTLAALAAVAGVTNALPFNGKTQVAKRDFNAKGSNNVAAWWGNSPDTEKVGLDAVCAADYDIVILTFATQVSASGVTVLGGAQPKTLGDSIKKCQAAGKKVMMSMGGATGHIEWSSDSDAQAGADAAAKAFLTSGSDSYYGVALDGIDIDNETNDSAHWLAFVTELRKKMSSSQYISGAPQCPMPDQNLDQSTLKAMDFVWVQYYNNGPCNHGGADFASSVQNWSKYIGDAQLYIATPGSSASAGSGYIDATAMAAEVASVKAMNLPNLGGYAIWDASTAIDNSNYNSVIKKALGGSSSGSSNPPASKPSSAAPAHTPAPTQQSGHGQGPADGTTVVQATSTAHVTSTTFVPSGAAPTGAPASSPTPVTGGTGSTGGSTGGAAAGTQSCSTPGDIVCSSDGSKFGICDGTSAIMMSVAQGTKCSNGAIGAASS